jgi:hypothetical protein
MVHWKTATFIMIVINTLVDKIIRVARLMPIHYRGYVIYSNCNMNECILNACDFYSTCM